MPVFVSLHLGGRAGWALAVFLAAALTDSLDGLLARLLHQRTKLGAFLDPLADKLLTGAALIMLFLEHEAPLWMVLLIAFRDGSIAPGAAVVKRKGLEMPAAPSRVGKYATFALTCFLVLGLMDVTFSDSPLLHAWFLVSGYFTGLCVAISTAQYFLRWGHLWVAPARRAPVSWVALALVLAAGPSELALPGFRMHVEASEELDPDRLRALARPEVVLWVRTRSNGLRRSTAETLQLAGSALRPGACRRSGLRRSRRSWAGWGRGWRSAGSTWPGCAAGRPGGWRWTSMGRSPRSSRRGSGCCGRWRCGGAGEGGPSARSGRGRGRSPGSSSPGFPGAAPVDCGAVPARTRVRVRVPLASLTADGVCGLPLRVEVPPAVDAGRRARGAARASGRRAAGRGGDEVARADAARRLLISSRPRLRTRRPRRTWPPEHGRRGPVTRPGETAARGPSAPRWALPGGERPGEPAPRARDAIAMSMTGELRTEPSAVAESSSLAPLGGPA